MRLLLDTHVFLWWDKQDRSLGEPARRAIEDAGNEVFVSAASVWEIAIKRRLGKLVFHGSPSEAIWANGFVALSILPSDAETAGMLDWAHGDPFDRLLVVQAQRLGLALVTADAVIREFAGLALLWAG